VTQTDEAEPDVHADGDLDDDDGAETEDAPLSELADEVGRATAALARRELELVAARNAPAVRRAGRDVALAVVAGVAFVTAFALANWAAVLALSSALADWLAPLVLAAGWCAVGAALLVTLRPRYQGLGRWIGDPRELVREREQARDEAAARLREAVDVLAGAAVDEALAQIREAVVPAADEIVDAGEEVLDLGEGVIDAADKLTDRLEDEVPAGSLVNGALDLALYPSRLSIRIARVALGRSGAASVDDPSDGA
jgi:hypothetical protein